MVPDNNDEVMSDGEMDESEEEEEEQEEEEAVAGPSGAGIVKSGGIRSPPRGNGSVSMSCESTLERLRIYIQELGVTLEPGWTVAIYAGLKTDVCFKSPSVRGKGSLRGKG